MGVPAANYACNSAAPWSDTPWPPPTTGNAPTHSPTGHSDYFEGAEDSELCLQVVCYVLVQSWHLLLNSSSNVLISDYQLPTRLHLKIHRCLCRRLNF